MDDGITNNNGSNGSAWGAAIARVRSGTPRPWENPGRGTEFMVITPEMAAEWLKRNTGNRPLSLHRVRQMAHRMRTGAWEVTHQGVTFSTDGTLLDGQHRLHAICEASVAVEFTVTWGLRSRAFDHIDSEGTRSAADLLAREMPDLRNRLLVTAVASQMLRGLSMESSPDKIVVKETAKELHGIITPFVDVLLKNELAKRAAIIAAFSAAVRGRDPFPGPRGHRDLEMVSLIAMRFGSQDWEGAEDPMKALQRRLLSDELGRKRSGVGLQRTHAYALTVSAIRNTLAGKRLSKIEATTVDWGDRGDTIKIGTGAARR